MNLFYLISAICFILGLKRLSHPKTARSGNFLAALGMLIAIAATLASSNVLDLKLIAIGVGIGSVIGLLFATRVQMTEMPQMVAIFNGLGGAASAFVASSEFFKVNDLGIIICISVFIGTLTFSGSFIAFGKLQGIISGRAITFSGQQILNALMFASIVALGSVQQLGILPDSTIFYVIVLLALLLGIGLTIPIGGADMPVVISLLNSYSGIAAAATGFLINNQALIISGSLVGASGLILTNITVSYTHLTLPTNREV